MVKDQWFTVSRHSREEVFKKLYATIKAIAASNVHNMTAQRIAANTISLRVLWAFLMAVIWAKL